VRTDELEDRVCDHLDRLEVAALAMFNRGQQDIDEEELGADIAALDPDQRPTGKYRPGEAGQRVIGEFFFVHAAEARPLTGPDEPGAGRESQVRPRETPRRSYEFLHATFGEYLVASRVMSELAEVAARAFVGRRGHTDPDDDLLYAILSHQPLVARISTLSDSQGWMHAMASWLIPAISGKDTPVFDKPPPEGTPEQDIQIVADLIFRYLRIARSH
jgi:hypothetical protein